MTIPFAQPEMFCAIYEVKAQNSRLKNAERFSNL